MLIKRLYDRGRALLLPMPMAAYTVFVVSTGALFAAYVAETFFGILPCELCYIQRLFYAVAAIASVAALLSRGCSCHWRAAFVIVLLAFIANLIVATFHTGVERQWWIGLDGCAVNPLVLSDPEAARKALLSAPIVRCDEVGFTFLGLTITNWNVLASLGLTAFSVLVLRRD